MEQITLDNATQLHQEQVKRYMLEFLKDHKNQFQYKSELITAAGIHDIGKSFIPESIFNAPRRLTSLERIVIDHHSYYGYKLAIECGYDELTSQMVLCHHGMNKPKDEEIYISSEVQKHALMLQVIDAYTALTSNRPYREALSDEVAMGILMSGKEFDSDSVELLKNWARREEVLEEIQQSNN